jgi:cell division protein FtsZ
VVEVPSVTEMPVAVTEIPQEESSVEETPFKLVAADEIEFEVENTWNEVQEEKTEEPVQGALFTFADYLAQEEAEEEKKPAMNSSQDAEPISMVEPEIPELTTFKLKVNETTSEEPAAPVMNMSRPAENEVAAVSMTFKQEEQHVAESRPPRTELMARNKEREARIREFTMRMKSPQGLNELESEPAFVRRKVALDETPHSSENTLSRTISKEVTDENGNVRIELRKNNPFLHDNVD